MVLTYLHFRILKFPLIMEDTSTKTPQQIVSLVLKKWWNLSIKHLHLILLGGAITIMKNDGVRQWEGWHPIYEIDNNPVMFETTNQKSYLFYTHHRQRIISDTLWLDIPFLTRWIHMVIIRSRKWPWLKKRENQREMDRNGSFSSIFQFANC